MVSNGGGGGRSVEGEWEVGHCDVYILMLFTSQMYRFGIGRTVSGNGDILLVTQVETFNPWGFHLINRDFEAT